MAISRVSSDPRLFEAACGLGDFGWNTNGPVLTDTKFGIYQGTHSVDTDKATLVDYGSGEAKTYAKFDMRLGPPPSAETFGDVLYDAWEEDADGWPDISLRLERSGNTSLAEFLAPSLEYRFIYEATVFLPTEFEAAAAAIATNSSLTGGGSITILQMPLQKRNNIWLPGQIKASGGKGKADKVQWWPYWYDATPLKLDIADLSDLCNVWTTFKLVVNWFPSGANAVLSVNDVDVWDVSNVKTWEDEVQNNYMKYGLYISNAQGTSAANYYDAGTNETSMLVTGLRAEYELDE